MPYLMTVKQAAEKLAISEQSVRRHYKLYRIGRSVRILRSDVHQNMRESFQEIVEHDKGTLAAAKAYWKAQALLEYLDNNGNEDAIACPVEAGLLASTMAALALDHPDYPVVGVEEVYPPALAYVRKHLPQGGGSKGDALRAKLLREG